MNAKKLKNIEDYFEGNLSKSDQKIFEKQQQEDKGFAEEVDLFQVSKAIIKANHRDQLIGDAQKMMDEYHGKKLTLNSTRKMLRIAAALVTIFAAIWVFKSQFSTPSPTELFANHFEIPKISNVRGTDVDEMWESASQLYDSGKYEEAAKIFESLLINPSFSLKDRTWYYLGISYLMTNNFQKSLESFKEVSPNSSFIQQSEWYASLAYLKQGNIQKAKEQILKIADSDTHYKRKEAKKILESLE